MSEERDDQPDLNMKIEDFLAHGSSEADHVILLKTWMMMGAEYMARAAGRQYTLDSLENLHGFIREVQPAKAWKP